jgi:membrane-anchored glycerophosphoryl diester phosphodiesterase (GDPDase)
MVPLGLLFLWLGARFSCATPAMASRGSLNFLEAVRESWHVTAPRQGRIMLYLALVGLLFGLVYLIFAGIFAAAVGVTLASGGVPSMGIGTILLGIAMGVLMAYVSVLVPAGIYRAAAPDVDASAAVFE